jgi:hypothetical protein
MRGMQVQVRFKKSAFTICTPYIIYDSFYSFKISENTAFSFFHGISLVSFQRKAKIIEKIYLQGKFFQ